MNDFDPKKNYYEILGLSENANPDEIKKAFRKFAVKHHPDKGGDKKKFQEINEAYQVLGDEKKKQQYDAYRKGGFSGFDGGGGFGGFDFGGGGANVDFGGFDLDDIVGNIFGGGFGGFGGGGRQRKTGGDDIKIAIDITFEEAFLGTEKKIAYNRLSKVSGAEERICSDCNGHGKVAKRMNTPFGIMQSESVCNKCGGSGRIYFKDGKELVAGGLEKIKNTISAKIPAGIDDGSFIKFAGKGNVGSAGNSGDLYIKINVLKSKIFERKGENLYTKVNLNIFDLVLGGEITVDHPEGKLKVKIPKGTQIGDMIKISGKGFGHGGIFAKKGDMFLIPKLEIPKRLSKEQEQLWSQLKKTQ
ncbi:MAG: DnaJ C-terminal domain-containing protein [Candidatus Absconditabacterales bacterium]